MEVGAMLNPVDEAASSETPLRSQHRPKKRGKQQVTNSIHLLEHQPPNPVKVASYQPIEFAMDIRPSQMNSRNTKKEIRDVLARTQRENVYTQKENARLLEENARLQKYLEDITQEKNFYQQESNRHWQEVRYYTWWHEQYFLYHVSSDISQRSEPPKFDVQPSRMIDVGIYGHHNQLCPRSGGHERSNTELREAY